MSADETDIIAEARIPMDGFMTAFNAEDIEALRSRWFHFPHVRFHGDNVNVMETPADLKISVWDRQGQSTGWASSSWDCVEPIDVGPNKVHFRVQFSRFLADGSLIGSYKSLYIVTKTDGRWAIQARSTWAA